MIAELCALTDSANERATFLSQLLANASRSQPIESLRLLLKIVNPPLQILLSMPR